MSDYLPPVIAKLIADTRDHNREVREAGDVWVDTARRVRSSSQASAASVEASQSAQAASTEASTVRVERAHRRHSESSRLVAAASAVASQRTASQWAGMAGHVVMSLALAGGSLGWFLFRVTGVGGAVAGAIGPLASLAAKIFAVGSAAAAAVALIGALPIAISALVAGAGVLFGAFSGIGGALSAYKADQEAAAQAATSGSSAMKAAAKSIRDAYKGIEAAQRQAARTARDGAEAIEAAAERVQDAMKSAARASRDLADAIKDQARAQRDAAESIIQAQRRTRDAARDAEKAEISLDKARQQAAKTIEDLQEKVSDLALDQEGAAIAVAEAEKAYYREMRSSEATELSRRKAAYELAVARERQSDLEREAAETIRDSNDAQARGVEGAEDVIDAKERQERAAEDLADATKAQQQAEEDAADSIAMAARRVSDARESEAEAIAGVAAAERELARTKRNAAEANEDAARSVADAMERLKDAQDAAAESLAGAAGAGSKFQAAMAKLTQEGRDFVYKLIEIKEQWKETGKIAQRTALPGMTQMLEDSKAMFPVINEGVAKVGMTLGDMSRKWGALFKNQDFQRDFGRMMTSSTVVLNAFNDGLLMVTRSWVRLAGNGAVSTGFANLLKGALGGISGLFDVINENGDDFGRILTALGDILRILTPAIGELAAQFAGPLADILEYIAGLLKEHEGHLGEWITKILALYAAFKLFRTAAKFGMLLAFASQVTGLFPHLDKLTKKLKGVGKGMRTAGLIGAVGTGLAIADEFLPEATPEEEASLTPGYKDLKNITGAANQLLTDPAGVAKDISEETAQWGDTWSKGEAPIQKFFGSIGTWASQAGTDISNFSNNTRNTIGSWVAGRATDFSNFSTNTRATVGNWVVGRATDISNWATTTGTNIGNWASTRASDISTWATNTGNNISGWATRTASDIGTGASNGWNNASAWFGRLGTDAGTWFGGLWSEGTTRLSGLATDASTWSSTTLSNLGSNLGNLGENARTWFGGLKDGAIQKGDELVAWMRNLPSTIKSKLGDLKNLLLDKGREIVTGLWNGIVGMGSWLYNNVMSWIKSVIPTPIANALGIHSPSRVTADLIKWVPIAAEETLIAGARRVTAASKGLGTATAEGFRAGVRPTTMPAMPLPSTGRTAAGGTVVENHYHIAGSVLAERELLDLVQVGANKYAKRNTSNGLGGGGGA